ncbi:MAG: hypothetical protein AAB393_14640, partial [Bacteroidota bacterium]
MRRSKVLGIGGVVMAALFLADVQAQVRLEWAKRYNGPANDLDGALAIAVDDSGYVYVTGGSLGVGTNLDYATIKYDASGDSLWVRRFNSGPNIFDLGWDLLPDDSANLYVTGGSATLKYDRLGTLLWT